MASKKKGQTVKASQEKKTQTGEEGKISFSPARIREFVQEVQAEFKKVVWPEKKVTVGLTGFVMILVVLISIYLGTVDLLLGKLVSLVLQ
ncbi:MAG: preprotein translocase subunit SecE [Desulfobulbaceae bacterium]|nr:preprotein translocase subunit SecE [Desulfobulbaceae bacterium]